jgi:hypothetical protein
MHDPNDLPRREYVEELPRALPGAFFYLPAHPGARAFTIACDIFGIILISVAPANSARYFHDNNAGSATDPDVKRH